MSDWDNTPIRQRLNARQVKIEDIEQDAFVGEDDSLYYDDVITNASELAAPDAPSALTLTDNTAGQGTVTWTDEGYNSDDYHVYYAAGSFTIISEIIANGTRHPSPDPTGTVISPGAGTYSVAVAGINEFGSGDYSIIIGTIT